MMMVVKEEILSGKMKNVSVCILLKNEGFFYR